MWRPIEIHSSTKKVCRDRERLEETKETVETTEDTCKYKIAWRFRERLKRLWRPWRPATCKYKLYGESGRG